MRDTFLQRIQAIIQRQLCETPERHNNGFFHLAQTSGANTFWPHGGVMNEIPFPSFLNGFGIHPIALGKRDQAFLIILYLSTHFRSRAGASAKYMSH